MAKKSKSKSIASKAISKVKSSASNIKKGASIAGKAVSSKLNSLSKAITPKSSLNFKVGEGLSSKQTANAYSALSKYTGGSVGGKTPAPTLGNIKLGPIKPAIQGPLAPIKVINGKPRSGGGSSSDYFDGGSFQSPISSPLTTTSSFSRTSSPSGVNNTIGGNISGTGTNTGGITNVVNAMDIGAGVNQKLDFAGTDPNDYLKDSSFDILGVQETELEKAQKDSDDILQKMLDSVNDVPDTAKIEQKLRNQLGIEQKQQAVNDLTGQLNAIVAKGQANQLAQVGQGRGIPEAIIGGIQAQIGRETAIAALPVQAQLQAAQGNLEMANDSLDRLFKIYSDDATNAYNARNKSLEMVYNVASKKEQRLLDEQKVRNDREYQETQDLNDERNAYAKMAFANGQSSLGAKIARLDYKSPTFKADLANLSSQIVDNERNLRIQKLQQDLAESGTVINPKILATSQFKSAQSAQNLKNTLKNTKAAIEKYGNFERVSGEGKGVLNALKIQLASQISTAFEQGVIQPGEMENFQKVAGQLQSSFFGIPNVRNSVSLGSISNLEKTMDDKLALEKAALTNTYQVTPEQLDTLLNITDLSDQEYADMDALID